MSWDIVERWVGPNVRYAGFVIVLVVGVLGVAHAAAM